MRKKEIPEAITTAVASMLAPYCPGLTPTKLEAAINNEPEVETETLLTRKEAAVALHVSMPTLDRCLRDSVLNRVAIRGRVFIRQSEVDRVIRGEVMA